MNPITGLLAALAALTVFYIGAWTRIVAAALRDPNRGSSPATDARVPSPLQTAIGAVTNFFDTLGIGSFATTTALFRAFKLVPDRIIPGTLNAGHTLPTVAQAFIYTSVIPFDVLTLFSMIAAAVLGAWLGAGVVAHWSKRKVQIGMGMALLAAAVFFTMRNLSLFPAGSGAIGVRGVALVAAIGGNFMLGALMSLGIGLYAPCMVLVSLLGMSERTAFPIMMGSCAFLMPIASMQFIRRDAYNLRAAVGLALGGPLAVLLAYWLVTGLPTPLVRVLVLIVILYTSITMLRSAAVEKRAAGTGPPLSQPA
jgi:uncharacterized membrane protein YfcA